ncbi:MAG: hypothetical protein LC729_03330 [Acidobacteria bacterium]|nr:hypothetical protein [Acidobacteriota bacterium]
MRTALRRFLDLRSIGGAFLDGRGLDLSVQHRRLRDRGRPRPEPGAAEGRP